MEETVQQNIPYQPPQENYSYIKPKTPLLIKFLYLFIGTLLAVLLFGGFLFILNSLNLISLSSLLPTSTRSSLILTPVYDPTTNSFQATGTLSGYDNEKISLKYGINNLQLIYTNSSVLLIAESESQKDNLRVGTLSDLDKKDNIGKKIIVDYGEKNGQKIIYTIKIVSK